MTQTTLASPPQAPARRGFARWFLGFVAAAVLLLVAYIAFMLWWSYSEGDRAGVLQKFSKRGWVCKTYEGELALYVVGGVAPQIWNFTVRDDKVAQSLDEVVGRQVRLHYSEHPGLPTTCFGETAYFVEGFEVVSPAEPVEPGSGLSVKPVAPPVEDSAVR